MFQVSQGDVGFPLGPQKGVGKGLLMSDMMCFLPLDKTHVVDCSLIHVREKPATWATNIGSPE